MGIYQQKMVSKKTSAVLCNNYNAEYLVKYNCHLLNAHLSLIHMASKNKQKTPI